MINPGMPQYRPVPRPSVARGSGAAPAAQPQPTTTPVQAADVVSTALNGLGSLIESFLLFLTRLVNQANAKLSATAPVTAQPVPAPAPAPTSSVPAQPGAASLGQAIARLQPGQPLSLGAGTFSVDNFGSNLGSPLTHVSDESLLMGMDLAPAVTGIAGAGVDKTVIQMTPRTSTHAGDIPTQVPETNQFSLLRVEGSPQLHDFTLKGTDQGHLYNGLRVHEATNARVTNVKVTGIPGDNYMPPGETFGMEDYRGTNNVYENIEVDGQGVGASGFGANISKNTTIRNGYFHDNPHSCAATFWRCEDVTLLDCKAANNHAGFNFEQVSGTVNIVRPQVTNCRDADISIASDQGSASYTITDPVLAPGQTLRIMVPEEYNGVPNQQKKSDIHVVVHGVDVTDQVVTWCT